MASDAVSHLGLPLQDPAVSADLEAIFGRPPPTSGVARPRAARVAKAPGAGEAQGLRRLSAASLGALAAAALAGIAAGSLLVKAPGRTPATPAPPPAALPVEMLPPLQTPQAADAALAAVAMAPVETHAAPISAATGAVHTVRHAARPHTYAQVVAADHRLRAAYAAAIRAGAPRAILVADRERWVSLRRRAAHDPVRLVAGYDAIARDLDQAAVHVIAEEDQDRAPATGALAVVGRQACQHVAQQLVAAVHVADGVDQLAADPSRYG